ncbi:hypothetical protein [Microbacterium sp. SORGH_AS_0888]|uniref:hypothetical protein n=1 Tax=Microbacterium sp. SORGH_AS_0888 TaxID=3041791 RepID=UPI00277EF77A|nr:hypothetical protein [Microbacterium sp. SORGH_AS_0888]MDQ1130367.1 hypothetical protein [Microbacterium sp. SORGH_AS_0888]
MVGYGDLGDLIPRFKRAAIDAYMRTSPSGWQINGDTYEINSSGAHYKVSRPGADGEGGGDWSSDNFIANIFVGGAKDDEFREAFDSIRARIDTALSPWRSLPEPSEVEAEVEAVRQVTRRLSGAAAASEGGQVGSGVIPGNLALILENSDAMAGTAIAAFKSKFVAQLGPVIGGLHGLSVVLGSAVAAEKGLWEAARQNVAEIVEAGRAASQSLADSGATGQLKVALQVAGWAAKGAKIFVPGAAQVFEVVGLGIEVVQGAATDNKTETIEGADAVGVLSAFEGALEALNGEIRAEEALLQDNLTKNLANVRADRSSYDLSVPPVRNDPGTSSDVIAYQPALIQEITRTYLPAIASELTETGSTLLSASLGCIMRDGALGIDARGPGAAWSEMRWLLNELLRNLSWDVTKGAENLDLVLQDLQSHEQQVADDIAKVLAELDAGNPTDPWN